MARPAGRRPGPFAIAAGVTVALAIIVWSLMARSELRRVSEMRRAAPERAAP